MHIPKFVNHRSKLTGRRAWTDDTSMTLCLAQSIIDNEGAFMPYDTIRKWVAWYHHGYLSVNDHCFDIGNQTRLALGIWNKYFQKYPNAPRDVGDGEDHRTMHAQMDHYLKRPSGCGNGALMRVAPIGLTYYRSLDTALAAVPHSCRPTHSYITNIIACKLYTTLIVGSLNGSSKEKLVADIAAFNWSESESEPDGIATRFSKYKTIKDWSETAPSQIKSSGYVVDTLEASLWAFFSTPTFKDGAIKVVNLGDDADTVGAVYGGIAGAFYGFDAIPDSWLQGLQRRQVVEGIATKLALVAGTKDVYGQLD